MAEQPDPVLPGETQAEPDANEWDAPESTTEGDDQPPSTRPIADFLNRAKHSFYLWSGLLIALFGFYALADFTAYMTGQERPGQLIFSNTMTQLWTAAFRLTFVLGGQSWRFAAVLAGVVPVFPA